jgi:S1-C subfamily serine protease
MQTINIIFILFFITVAGIAITALVIATKNNNKLTATNIAFTPVAPTLTTETNVQSALQKLNLVATSSSNGLMSSADKEKLSQQQISNGGAIVYEKAHNGTCSVITSTAGGSGFIIDVISNKLTIVTAAHVVLQNSAETPSDEPDTSVSVVVSSANGDNNLNVQVSCNVIGWDQAADIAVLQTKTVADDPGTGFDFTPAQQILQWTDSDAARIGQDIYAIGDPLTQDFQSISGGNLRDNKYLPTANSGSVESIAFSCPITPGNSGGPVLDSNAQMSNFTFTGYESFGGGVNSYMASRIVPRLLTNTNNKGYLGITSSVVLGAHDLETLRDIYPAFKASNYDVVKGLLVLSVEAGASTAGIQNNDIIIAVNDIQIGPFFNQFSPTRVTWFAQPGSTVTVDIIRPSIATPLTFNVLINSFPASRDIVFTRSF